MRCSSLSVCSTSFSPQYRYAFSWTPRTVLMWDNMGTIHNAIADYRPDEHRLIKRCQVAATRFFAAA